MTRKIHILGLATLMLAAFSACAGDDGEAPATPPDTQHTPMTFRVVHPAATRATDTDFEDGDRIGLFVAADSLPLDPGGNLVSNEPLARAGGAWNPAKPLYWEEGTYTAYAYYPYQPTVSSTDELPFSVAQDQHTARSGETPGGYEASDLLYAKTTGLVATSAPVSLIFRHLMSKIRIQLIKGEDYAGELPEDAAVYVHSTVPTATVDLGQGVVTRDPKGKRQTIRARQDAPHVFSAIVVPQRLDNRLPLVEVVVGGVSYLYESKFQFKPGVEHLVNLVLSKNPETVSINVAGETKDWE